jgi:catechol 2,3-dioxygenase-like lactoylglutathione lyase family enzyme
MSIQTERIGHVTLIGSNEKDAIDFYTGVLGMPLVLRQPNLDDLETLHLIFDVGHGSYLTFFVHDDTPSDPSPVPWAIGSTHHVAMDVTEEVFERALTSLREHNISHSGRVDRGAFWSMYFRDHNGMLLELSSWKVAIPTGIEKGAVLARAQQLREADGSGNVKEQHVRQALEQIVAEAGTAVRP